VVLINRRRQATVKKERVAYWTWEERRVTSLAALRELSEHTLLDRVLRLHVEMSLPAPEFEEAERLLEALAGTPASHGKVGVLELHRQGLELETRNVDSFCADLPDVLRSTVERLQAAAEDPAQRLVAQRALFHLYRSVKSRR
jgi:hypothetical protein